MAPFLRPVWLGGGGELHGGWGGGGVVYGAERGVGGDIFKINHRQAIKVSGTHRIQSWLYRQNTVCSRYITQDSQDAECFLNKRVSLR